MLRVAIAGNIASGKSTVQNILKSLGYCVIDTDKISKDLRVSRKDDIIKAYSEFDIVDENGEISSKKLSQIVFDNNELLKRLADLMHPWIKEIIIKYFEENSDKSIIFVGIPLLFEAKMEKLFDKILFIYTDDEIRLQRLLKRNNYTIEHAKNRIKCQMSQNLKVEKSDFVINNNTTEDNLKSQVLEFISKLGV